MGINSGFKGLINYLSLRATLLFRAVSVFLDWWQTTIS